MEVRRVEVRLAGDCGCVKGLGVTGGDLIDAGVKAGPEIGGRLNRMLAEVLRCPEHNTKEYLLRF